MARFSTPTPGLGRLTGYSASKWNQKLTALYNDAKRRNGGNSLSIYGRVSEMADILEGVMPMPEGWTVDTLAGELNNLASDLRRA